MQQSLYDGVKSFFIVISTLEQEIAQMVYALYGLTPEEIAIVEGGE